MFTINRRDAHNFSSAAIALGLVGGAVGATAGAAVGLTSGVVTGIVTGDPSHICDHTARGAWCGGMGGGLAVGIGANEGGRVVSETATTIVSNPVKLAAVGAQSRRPSEDQPCRPPTYRFGDVTRGIIAKGRLSRAGELDKGYMFGDFTRGIFSSQSAESAMGSIGRELDQEKQRLDAKLAHHVAEADGGVAVRIMTMTGDSITDPNQGGKDSLRMHPEARCRHIKMRIAQLQGHGAPQQTLLYMPHKIVAEDTDKNKDGNVSGTDIQRTEEPIPIADDAPVQSTSAAGGSLLLVLSEGSAESKRYAELPFHSAAIQVRARFVARQ